MDQLKQIGVQIEEAVTLSYDLLAMSEQGEPDLDRLEIGFQNRGKLLEEIRSGSSSIDWQDDFPAGKRERLLKSFEDLREVDTRLREHVTSLLDHKKSVLLKAQQNEKADKRYQKKQRVDNAMFIRNKLEG